MASRSNVVIIGGGIGGLFAANALIGDWKLVTVIPIGGDLQTTTVLWQFAADLTCRRTVTTLLVSEGTPKPIDSGERTISPTISHSMPEAAPRRSPTTRHSWTSSSSTTSWPAPS